MRYRVSTIWVQPAETAPNERCVDGRGVGKYLRLVGIQRGWAATLSKRMRKQGDPAVRIIVTVWQRSFGGESVMARLVVLF
jgi:hypothetical protein